jgi:tryptophan synthase beta chain
MVQPTKILLSTQEMVRSWLNLAPALAKVGGVPDPRDAGEGRLEAVKTVLPKALWAQETATQRDVTIPGPMTEQLLRVGRPTPLQRAYRLERELKTPAKLFYKREDISYSTSDKSNTAIPQAFFAAQEGFAKVISGGGAVWGSALSIGATYQKLVCEFFLPHAYLQSKEPHRIQMETNGVMLRDSPSGETAAGRGLAAKRPDEAGNVGIALSEAIERAAAQKAALAFGGFFRFTHLHQSVVGLEVQKQLESVGLKPDVVVGSLDGFLGLAAPFLAEEMERGKSGKRFVVAQSMHVPVLQGGTLDYDFADAAGIGPQFWGYSLGSQASLPLIHAGEFRHHAASPTLSRVVEKQWAEVRNYGQTEAFEAAALFSKTQGIIPSHEAQYAIKAVMDEAIQAKKENAARVILFNLNGHSMLEHAGYQEFLFDKKLAVP